VSSSVRDSLCEPVLVSAGIPHGFGQRGSQVPDFTFFPKQVHGIEAFDVRDSEGSGVLEADAVLTSTTGMSLGIVTADCVPVLAAACDGRAVAAIHAGWRGLADGVIEAGIEALRSKHPGVDLVCAVGPAARACCYEVDAPVRDGLSERYGKLLEEVLVPTAPGHYQLDLPLLATRILEQIGVDSTRIGIEHRVCTICDSARFESYRRDGVAAGRLRHFISIPATIPRQG
jgi:YfiH family protein